VGKHNTDVRLVVVLILRRNGKLRSSFQTSSLSSLGHRVRNLRELHVCRGRLDTLASCRVLLLNASCIMKGVAVVENRYF
jgi:hypothetical protein